MAVKFGPTRLIDNVLVEYGEGAGGSCDARGLWQWRVGGAWIATRLPLWLSAASERFGVRCS